jgi:hypothetical protein
LNSILLEQNRQILGEIGAANSLINVLNDVAASHSKEVIRDVLYAVETMAFVDQNREKFLQLGIVQILVRLLSSEEDEIKAKAVVSLRILGSTSVHRVSNTLLQSGGIPVIVRLLSATDEVLLSQTLELLLSFVVFGKFRSVQLFGSYLFIPRFR